MRPRVNFGLMSHFAEKASNDAIATSPNSFAPPIDIAIRRQTRSLFARDILGTLQKGEWFSG